MAGPFTEYRWGDREGDCINDLSQRKPPEVDEFFDPASYGMPIDIVPAGVITGHSIREDRVIVYYAPTHIGATGNVIDPEGINHPSHYNEHPSGVECIEIVEHMTFNVGNAIKYMWRSGLKDGEPDEQALRKAKWYIDREIVRVHRAAKEGDVTGKH